MIPAEAASSLRLLTPDLPAATQPVAPAQQVTDALSNLVPGQRIIAQIQALLPNGAYRAIVAQRDVTLALPFSAKAGDSLELEVVETNGKVSLAIVPNRDGAKTASTTPQSVPTNLSPTGRLIGDLLAGVGGDGKRAQPAALNSNQPLVANMPVTGQALVPILKDALGKSGMFYEAHQALWAEGKLPTADLLQQPQGRLSPTLQEAPGSTATNKPNDPSSTAAATLQDKNTAPTPLASPVRSELTPLVQQQLDALASQNYVWQGQVWQGQHLHWEIQEKNDGSQSGEDDSPDRWQTRLKLTLPNLGGVEASLRLRPDNAVEIAMLTTSESGHISLSAAAASLRQQLESAGLTLSSWSIKHDESTS